MIYPKNFWRNPIHWLAFGLGSGLSPKAPGTVGTLMAVPFGLLFWSELNSWQFGLLWLVALIAGVYICEQASAALKVHDHGGIVWDEFVGYWLVLWAAPPLWWWPIAAFVLFRLFDILKPWPIGWLDRQVSGGLGIMLDDVAAGLMAAGCLWGGYWLWF